eukprot:3337045-Alexandrium_andersonii.AAC.1
MGKRRTSIRSSPSRYAGKNRRDPTLSNGASKTARSTVSGSRRSSRANSSMEKEAASSSAWSAK